MTNEHNFKLPVGLTCGDTLPTVYISGPMTGLPQYNFPAFDAAEAFLRDAGCHTRNPTVAARQIATADQLAGNDPISNQQLQQIQTLDIRYLLESDAVVLLPDWQKSAGAKMEVALAQWMLKPVYELQTGEPVDTLVQLAAVTAATEPAPEARTPETVFEEAQRIIGGERQADYGSPEENFTHTAALWSAYKGVTFTPVEVVYLMTLLKLSRLRHRYKRDSLVDGIGYLGIADRLSTRTKLDAYRTMKESDQRHKEDCMHLYSCIGDTVDMDYLVVLRRIGWWYQATLQSYAAVLATIANLPVRKDAQQPQEHIIHDRQARVMITCLRTIQHWLTQNQHPHVQELGRALITTICQDAKDREAIAPRLEPVMPIVQSDFGSTPCQPAGTLVRMTDGSEQQVSDIQPGAKAVGAHNPAEVKAAAQVLSDQLNSLFAEWRQNKQIELHANPEYERPSEPKGESQSPEGSASTEQTGQLNAPESYHIHEEACTELLKLCEQLPAAIAVLYPNLLTLHRAYLRTRATAYIAQNDLASAFALTKQSKYSMWIRVVEVRQKTSETIMVETLAARRSALVFQSPGSDNDKTSGRITQILDLVQPSEAAAKDIAASLPGEEVPPLDDTSAQETAAPPQDVKQMMMDNAKQMAAQIDASQPPQDVKQYTAADPDGSVGQDFETELTKIFADLRTKYPNLGDLLKASVEKRQRDAVHQADAAGLAEILHRLDTAAQQQALALLRTENPLRHDRVAAKLKELRDASPGTPKAGAVQNQKLATWLAGRLFACEGKVQRLVFQALETANPEIHALLTTELDALRNAVRTQQPDTPA
jgi:Domain of unknown function (DUF6378)/Domain of unknown function (DUF4406)